MATLSRKFVEQGKSLPHDGPEDTMYRLRLYFQSMGLPQQQATEVAEQIMRRALDHPSGPAEDLTSDAINGALEAVSQWLDGIAATTANRSSDLRLQLAWFLQPLLVQHPDAFGRSIDLHKDFRQAVQAAGKPILPPSSPTTMPPQPLGELPRLWYRLVAYCNLFWERLDQAFNQEK